MSVIHSDLESDDRLLFMLLQLEQFLWNGCLLQLAIDRNSEVTTYFGVTAARTLVAVGPARGSSPLAGSNRANHFICGLHSGVIQKSAGNFSVAAPFRHAT
jgi:hypothetical protein